MHFQHIVLSVLALFCSIAYSMPPDLRAMNNWAKNEKFTEKLTSIIGGHSDDIPDAIVVVDPFSTGSHLAAEICRAGLLCVRVLSMSDSPLAAHEGVPADYVATIQYDEENQDVNVETNKVVEEIRNGPFRVIAVIPGAESGVELADRLSARLGVRTNGEEGSLARRNKFFMGEKVRAAGTRAVKQRLCASLEEMKEFLGTFEGPRSSLKCVVKPVQSVCTDNVFLCSNADEAEDAFLKIIGTHNGLGLLNDAVLVQEFMEGKEYVIDKVSKNGVHKIMAVWEYDKRSVNGKNFIYFGTRLVPSDTPKAQEMIAYADKVLDALGVVHGPSHMEVMYTATGPCLVEVGSRCHGGEGSWLPIVEECIGYNVVNVTLDVYSDGPVFDTLNKDSYKMLKYGYEVDLVSRHSGVIQGIPGDSMIRSLPSFRSIKWEVKPGDYVPMTVDFFTRPGGVQLIHESEEQTKRDFDTIHALEEHGLFDYVAAQPQPAVVMAQAPPK